MYIYWMENICLKFVIVNTMTTFYPPTHCISLFKKLFWCIQFYGIESAQKNSNGSLLTRLKRTFFFDPVLFQCTNNSSKNKNKDFVILYHRVLNDSWMIEHRNCMAKWLGQRGAKIKRRAFCSTETSMIKFEAAYNFIFPGVCMHSALSSCLYLPHFDVLVIIFQFSTPPLLTT